MSINLKHTIFISTFLLLFGFGCATVPPEIITTPGPEQEPPPKQEERQPAPPPPAQADTVTEQEQTPAPSVEPQAPRSTVPETKDTDRTVRRAIASLRLTEQARLMIESKKPDEAISLLEKAINIDPGNGSNYYYLAEAWMIKGNRAQALEFNRMAEIYLGDNADWKARVQRQKGRIEKME